MNQAEKQQAISELSEKLKDSDAVFLMNYRGLKVSEMTALRHELSKVQARMQVVKNRLMKRALSEEGKSDLDEHLKGPTAIAFVSEDPVGVAKILTKYEEEFEPLELRVGVVRGELIGLDDIKALSKLPSKEQLYAKLLGTLMAPASNLVRALQGSSAQLARVMGAIRDQKT